jgi:hypothetical protein
MIADDIALDLACAAYREAGYPDVADVGPHSRYLRTCMISLTRHAIAANFDAGDVITGSYSEIARIEMRAFVAALERVCADTAWAKRA